MNKVLFAVLFSVLLLVPLGAQNVFAGQPCEPGFTFNTASGFCETPATSSCPFTSSTNAAGFCEVPPVLSCAPGLVVNPFGKCVDGLACPPPGTLIGNSPFPGIPGPSCSAGSPPIFGSCPAPYSAILGVCSIPPNCPVGFTPDLATQSCVIQATLNCPPPLGGPNAAGKCEQAPTVSCPLGITPIGLLCRIASTANEIGGKIIPLETTSLLLAGAQSFSWMIPVVVSGIGIGLFVVSRKNE